MRKTRLHDLTLASRITPWLRPDVRVPASRAMFPVETAELGIASARRRSDVDDESEAAAQQRKLQMERATHFAANLLSNSASTVLHLAASDVLSQPAFLHELICLVPKQQQQQHGANESAAGEDAADISTVVPASRIRLHCASSEMAADAANLIRSLAKPSAVGITLPFPASESASTVLFKRTADAVAQQVDEVLRYCAPKQQRHQGEAVLLPAVPISVFLLSALSCPFGGSTGVDPVRVADCAVHFATHGLSGAEELFFDDTAASVTSRHLEASFKTLLAISAGRVDTARQVSLALRKAPTAPTGIAASATTGSKDASAAAPAASHTTMRVDEKSGSVIISRRSNSGNHAAAADARIKAESNERLLACVAKAIEGLQMDNFCCLSPPSAASADLSSWPRTMQLFDWSTHVRDRSTGSDDILRVGETLLQAQQRLVEGESKVQQVRQAMLTTQEAAMLLSAE